jgi:hypothetical protein
MSNSRSLPSGLKELRLSGSMVGQQWDLLAFLPASITYLDLSRTDLAMVSLFPPSPSPSPELHVVAIRHSCVRAVAWLRGDQDQNKVDPHGWSDAFMFTIDQRLPRLEVLNMNHRAWVCIPRFFAAAVRSIGVVVHACMPSTHTRHDEQHRPRVCLNCGVGHLFAA